MAEPVERARVHVTIGAVITELPWLIKSLLTKLRVRFKKLIYR